MTFDGGRPLISGPHPPTPDNGKNKKEKKNDLHALKQILYDMGPLTVARWLFQKVWKFKPPI